MKFDRYTYRGKRLNNGEWIYGDLLRNSKISIAKRFAIGQRNGQAVIIDNETVGQCTGLTDKNGTEIFEGDIVKIDGGVGKCLILHVDGGFAGTGILGSGPVEFRWWKFCKVDHSACEIEVIGNIHDNPQP